MGIYQMTCPALAGVEWHVRILVTKSRILPYLSVARGHSISLEQPAAQVWLI